MPTLLPFEQPLADLDNKLDKARKSLAGGQTDAEPLVAELEQEYSSRLRELYADLTPWDIVQVARHPGRPYTLDFIRWACTDFIELHGDRRFGDDPALVGGLAALDGLTVVLLGTQKGRNTRDNLTRNFGMVRPEGYRKAQRLLLMAERLHLPVVTLVDTPGGSTGVAEEERGQAEAIASTLAAMLSVRTPIISIVTGEGGSGGALALSLGDRLLALEYTIYAVASPEASASILWRSAAQAPRAAAAMRITARDLQAFGVVDDIIPEPAGGAHRDHQAAALTLRDAILRHLHPLLAIDPSTLLRQRHDKYRRIGALDAPTP